MEIASTESAESALLIGLRLRLRFGDRGCLVMGVGVQRVSVLVSGIGVVFARVIAMEFDWIAIRKLMTIRSGWQGIEC